MINIGCLNVSMALIGECIYIYIYIYVCVCVCVCVCLCVCVCMCVIDEYVFLVVLAEPC